MNNKRWLIIAFGNLLAAGWMVSRAATVEIAAGGGDGPRPGPAVGAKLVEPFGVAFGENGDWYICEYKGQKISRVDADGQISTYAGTGTMAYSGDGGPAGKAELTDPHGLVIGPGRVMYVADTRANRIRKIDMVTGTITTFAGSGEQGFSGDGGPATQATFNGIYAIDLTPSGEWIYLADLANRRVRAIDTESSIVTTIAGNGEEGVPSDRSDAAASPLVDPRAVAAAPDGGVYILDRRGNALRMVGRRGRIRTLIAPGDFSPDMNGPKHLCVDGAGNVIVADSENHLIRKYSPADGSFVTIAGTGEKGDRIVRDDPLKTQLNRPHGVIVDAAGALWISDSYNHRILKVTGW